MFLIYILCIIDQAWGQDGWILAKSFFSNFMDGDEVEVNKNAKKEQGQYPAILTKQAWSIKDLLYGQKITPEFRFCQTGKIPIARSGSQSERRIRFILPACGAGHIIKRLIFYCYLLIVPKDNFTLIQILVAFSAFYRRTGVIIYLVFWCHSCI